MAVIYEINSTYDNLSLMAKNRRDVYDIPGLPGLADQIGKLLQSNGLSFALPNDETACIYCGSTKCAAALYGESICG